MLNDSEFYPPSASLPAEAAPLPESTRDRVPNSVGASGGEPALAPARGGMEEPASGPGPGLPAPPGFTVPPPRRPAPHIPNLGHTLLLLVLAAITLVATEIIIFAAVMATHLFGNESPQQLLREPRLLIPCMAISYLIIVALAWALFSNLWRVPFPWGVHWNAGIVRRRGYLFLGVGILLSVCVQLLSNFLPIPKTLPIDDFFRTPADLWLIALFGTFLAPPCEELAFRGFLLPSLASAWDWLARRDAGAGRRSGMGRNFSQWAAAMQPRGALNATEQQDANPLRPRNQPAAALVNNPAAGQLPPSGGPIKDPPWSTRALVFSSIVTSIGFALLHANQLAHSLAPLAVLFTVSLVLCAVRLRFHSLAASSVVHAAYNGTIFVLIFYATDGFRHLDKLSR